MPISWTHLRTYLFSQKTLNFSVKPGHGSSTILKTFLRNVLYLSLLLSSETSSQLPNAHRFIKDLKTQRRSYFLTWWLSSSALSSPMSLSSSVFDHLFSWPSFNKCKYSLVANIVGLLPSVHSPHCGFFSQLRLNIWNAVTQPASTYLYLWIVDPVWPRRHRKILEDVSLTDKRREASGENLEFPFCFWILLHAAMMLGAPAVGW